MTKQSRVLKAEDQRSSLRAKEEGWDYSPFPSMSTLQYGREISRDVKRPSFAKQLLNVIFVCFIQKADPNIVCLQASALHRHIQVMKDFFVAWIHQDDYLKALRLGVIRFGLGESKN